MTKEEIMKKARELGKSIKESEEYKELVKAQKALDEDTETQEMLKNFDAKRNEIQTKQMVGQDIKEDLQNLEDMEKKIMERESMVKYAKAEDKFKKLIDDANKEIVKGMEEGEKEEENS